MTPAAPPPALPDPRPTRRSRGGRLVGAGGWVCLAATAGAWVLLRFGDEWVPATVAMFGPLRLLALPPAALLVAALFVNRRAARVLVPALLLTAGPVAGCCVPWPLTGDDPGPGPRLRVLTCNMHYAKIPAGPLDYFIASSDPDVVALQEWPPNIHSEVLTAGGWHTHREPSLFLASRYPIRRTERLGFNSMRDRGSVARYELDTPGGVVTVFSLHLASPREGLVQAAEGGGELNGIAANSEMRWTQSRFVAAAADRTDGPVVLVGDFNTPPHSAIFRQVWGRYEDAFSAAGWGWGYTFSARASAVRIDHILVGGGGRATRCVVGPDVGSPHRPVLADVAWPAASSGPP